jgi:TPR repeat protein
MEEEQPSAGQSRGAAISATNGRVDALELGPPFYAPIRDLTRGLQGSYDEGRCDHRDGSITEHTISYAPDDLELAITCSRQRCAQGHAMACYDLGMLHSPRTWYDPGVPAVRDDRALAMHAFRAGCSLRHGSACVALATRLEESGDVHGARRAFRAACEGEPPSITACSHIGERLVDEGNEDAGKHLLRIGCRGITGSRTAQTVQRSGCWLLAEMAARRGDLGVQEEYLRLECNHGDRALQACADVGLLLARQGAKSRALPYLRRACNALLHSASLFPEACTTLNLLEKESTGPYKEDHGDE